MHEIGLTNLPKLDKVSGSQTFKLKDKELSIPKPLVGGSSNPLDITMCTLYHDYMPMWIDSNPNREERCDNHEKK